MTGDENPLTTYEISRKSGLSWEVVLKYLLVFGMAAAGVGLMIAGIMAWTIGENDLLFTGFFTGAIFISAGGLGFLNCLDGKELK